MEECTGTITNNLFEGNSAQGESADGGAIEIWYGGPVVSHNLFRSNVATETGGAIRSGYSSADIHNNLLLANQPDAIHLSYDDSGPITANTFVGNSPYTLTTRTCCGYEGDGPTSAIERNIVADSGEVAVVVTGDLALASFAYNDVYGAGTALFDGLTDPTGSDGNVSVEPALLDLSSSDPADWDLHLAADSPLVDAGDSTATDPDGSTADIGAYGGMEAGDRDLDGDGYPEWWQPGPYDAGSYPGLGWDCDDDDDLLLPGSGC